MVTVDDPRAKKLFEATGRMFKFHNDRENHPDKPKPKDGVLYHYTTADGLKGIIENHELWATSAYYLNDSAEVLYGYGLLGQAIEAWLSLRSPAVGSISRGLAESFQSYFGNDAFKRDIVTPIYLACFCEESNLLSQWRAYGSLGGGYSVGFVVPSEGPVYGIMPEPAVYTARCVKVEYQRGKQLQRILEILDATLPILDEQAVTDAIRSINDPHSPLGIQQPLNLIQEMLVEESLGFKDEAFAVEHEWRFVVRSRQLLKQGMDDGDHSKAKIHLKTARGQLIPYIKFKPYDSKIPIYGDGKTLPIKSVRCGPFGDRISSWMAVRYLLDGNGYRSVRIDRSEISLAF